MRYQNRVLSKYLSLCTCNYPFYSACKSLIHRVIDFFIEQYENKMRKVPCYICCVCNDYLIRDQFSFLADVNISVKIFSVCSLHLMENNKFVKHVT